jgi:hypothetical protein
MVVTQAELFPVPENDNFVINLTVNFKLELVKIKISPLHDL